MPLEILGVLVVLGIGGVVLLVHLTRLSKPALLTDEAAARAAFLADYPDARIRAAHLADDNRAALIEAEDAPGLVAVIGAGRLTRRLAPGEVSALKAHETGLRLRLADWSAPEIDFACADGARRDTLKRLIEAPK